MTRNQQLKQCREMLKDIKPRLINECKRLISSGGLSYSDKEKNDYSNAKVLIKTALENEATQYLPLTTESRKAYNNLKHF
jgi:7,8-dihydro-6-hydroxymethylpterin-pyrophosphokinase